VTIASTIREAHAEFGTRRLIAEMIAIPLVLLLGLVGPMVVFGG